MDNATILCPHCHQPIDISQTLYAKHKSQALRDLANEKSKLESEIAQHRNKYKEALEDLKAKEQRIKKQEEQFAQRVKEESQKQLQETLKKQKEELRQKLKAEIVQEHDQELATLKASLEEKSKQLIELNQTKAEVEKLKLEKEEIVSQIKLQAQKEMSEKLKAEREKISKQLDEESALKLKEKDEQLAQIKRQLEETRRKAEQGSQQLQGEAQELVIEDWLSQTFPFDTIEEVKKGSFGADCIQSVHTRELANCGKICYESKNTKSFNRQWIDKLKEDMLKAGAELGVLVTSVYPKELNQMGVVDGIIVCSLSELKGVVPLLRQMLIRIRQTAQKEENRSDKMSLLYHYLTSQEFSMQLNAIVEGFVKLQEELDKEKRSMMASWKRRQKLINSVLENTTAMYGSLQGIAGNALSHIPALELPYDEEDEEPTND